MKFICNGCGKEDDPCVVDVGNHKCLPGKCVLTGDSANWEKVDATPQTNP